MATGSSVNGPRWTPGVLALVLIAAGCTVTDELIEPVGTTRIVFTAPQLAKQSLYDSQNRAQVAEWSISAACMDLDGTPVDLVNLTEGCAAGAEEETCDFVDTVLVLPTSDSRCAGGVAIGATPDGPVKIGLDLTFKMSVRRAEPRDDLGPDDHADNDAFVNSEDNCPLVPNDDQRDLNMDGIGDDCQIPDDTGAYLLDSDGDLVPDSLDNCVWWYNPSQENSSGVAADGIPDDIGDACEEQVAVVVDQTGSDQLTVVMEDIDLIQVPRWYSYVTVDFNDAVDCGDWTGDCRLNPSLVRLCVAVSYAAAGSGCS